MYRTEKIWMATLFKQCAKFHNTPPQANLEVPVLWIARTCRHTTTVLCVQQYQEGTCHAD